MSQKKKFKTRLKINKKKLILSIKKKKKFKNNKIFLNFLQKFFNNYNIINQINTYMQIEKKKYFLKLKFYLKINTLYLSKKRIKKLFFKKYFALIKTNNNRIKKNIHITIKHLKLLLLQKRHKTNFLFKIKKKKNKIVKKKYKIYRQKKKKRSKPNNMHIKKKVITKKRKKFKTYKVQKTIKLLKQRIKKKYIYRQKKSSKQHIKDLKKKSQKYKTFLKNKTIINLQKHLFFKENTLEMLLYNTYFEKKQTKLIKHITTRVPQKTYSITIKNFLSSNANKKIEKKYIYNKNIKYLQHYIIKLNKLKLHFKKPKKNYYDKILQNSIKKLNKIYCTNIQRLFLKYNAKKKRKEKKYNSRNLYSFLEKHIKKLKEKTTNSLKKIFKMYIRIYINVSAINIYKYKKNIFFFPANKKTIKLKIKAASIKIIFKKHTILTFKKPKNQKILQNTFKKYKKQRYLFKNQKKLFKESSNKLKKLRYKYFLNFPKKNYKKKQCLFLTKRIKKLKLSNLRVYETAAHTFKSKFLLKAALILL